MKKNIPHNIFCIKIGVTACSMFLSTVVFYGLGELVNYNLFKEKLSVYSEEIIKRTDDLISQVKNISSEAKSFDVYTPCSQQYIDALRRLLWPYPLIKDISYINNNAIICSALWGTYPAPSFMNAYTKKIKRDDFTWVFDSLINEGIIADVIYNNTIAITVSPFAFKRFSLDKNTKDFNAVVGNQTHTEHYFEIGSETKALEIMGHDKIKKYSFPFVKKCSKDNDLCVISAASYSGIYNESVFVNAFLVFVSLVTGILLSIIINGSINKSLSLSTRLREAVRMKKLDIVYQPIYKLCTRNIIGVEALLRWRDDKLGPIGPDVFIPIAEKHNFIGDITLYVLKKTVHEFVEHAKKNNIFLSININSSDLLSTRFKNELFSLIRKHHIPHGIIMLEITERQSANLGALQECIKLYKDEGVMFALDDFGTGYSNLNWLSKLSVDEIKIDKSLTDSIGTESINKKILPGLVEMFKNLSEQIVFEGVETQSQIDFLAQKLPCCAVQGWYFSKAVSLPDMIKKLEDEEPSSIKCDK